jgi:hypothetical protein
MHNLNLKLFYPKPRFTTTSLFPPNDNPRTTFPFLTPTRPFGHILIRSIDAALITFVPGRPRLSPPPGGSFPFYLC